MNAQGMDQLEYCYLVEDTDPEAMEMKIYIPKLMGNIAPGNTRSSMSYNSGAVENGGGGGGSVQTQNFIVAKVQDSYQHKHHFHDCEGCPCPNKNHVNTCGSTSKLAVCKHFHHDHHFRHLGDHGPIPKGAKLICLMMNGSIKDIIVTRMWCRWD